MKVNVAFQGNGACIKGSLGNNNCATTSKATFENSLIDGFVAGLGFKVSDIVGLFWKRGFLDLFFNLSTFFESFVKVNRVGKSNCCY